MPERNEEIVARLRRGYEAFSRGDFDAAAELFDPDIEFVRPGGLSPIRGTEAVRAWMEPDAFEQQVVEPLDFRVEGNKVLVRQHARARGAGSGIEFDVGGWAVWTVNGDGFATRFELYLPHQEAEALKAAGLEE